MSEGAAAAYRLEFYRTARGDCPAGDFLSSLPEGLRRKAAGWLRLLEDMGPDLRRPYADVLEGPIRELRVSFGRLEGRLLYFIQDRCIVVVHGFLKKTWKVGREEIESAKRRRGDWLAAFGGGKR